MGNALDIPDKPLGFVTRAILHVHIIDDWTSMIFLNERGDSEQE